MRVLLACEESQAVCKEFRRLGHEAYSCDIKPCSGGRPEWHIEDDVLQVLVDDWDMVIAFPPCTYLTVTGNRWFNVERYGEKALLRHELRDEAAAFFIELATTSAPKVAIENPVGVMSTKWRKPDQIIQPWQFGDAAEKKTCLWLRGLEPLNIGPVVEPPPRRFFKSGKSMPAWYADAWHSEDRATIRSKTFPGIARAMAEQWGGVTA